MRLDEASRILVRGTNWVGDAVLTTPALSAIRRSFPRARIHLLVVPWVAGLFEADERVDRVLLYERNGIHRGWKGKQRLVRRLRKESYDLAILLQNAFEAALIAWLAGIPRRAGYTTDGRALLLTHRAYIRKEDRRVHQSRYYLRMLDRLGWGGGEADLRLSVSDRSRNRVAEALAETPELGGKRRVVVAPGATYGSAKMWPVPYYGRLVRRIRREWDAAVILLGSDGERGICEAIRRAGGGGVLDLSGRIPLADSVAWIDAADLVISNDSGLMHVAAALRIPQVAIFGPTDAHATGPANPHAEVVDLRVACAPCKKKRCPTDHRCMRGIDPDLVYRAARALVERYWT